MRGRWAGLGDLGGAWDEFRLGELWVGLGELLGLVKLLGGTALSRAGWGGGLGRI